jgi:hypothetical protein
MTNVRLALFLATKAAAAYLLIAALVAFAACGGGSGAPADGDPVPGLANLQVQVLENPDGRVTSATGVGLADVPVSLIDTDSGQLIGTDVTDGAGMFEFAAVPITTYVTPASR